MSDHRSRLDSAAPHRYQKPMPGLMQNRRNALAKLLAVGLGLVTIPLLWLWMVAPPDPSYKGKRLSEHLLALDGTRYPIAVRMTLSSTTLNTLAEEHNHRRREAESAVQELGPRAIPLLASWLDSDSNIRARLRGLATNFRFRWLWRSRWVRSDPRAIAHDAVSRLIPQHAVPLVPALRRKILGNDAPVASMATELLTRILDALPADESRGLARQNSDLIDTFLAAAANQQRGAAIGALVALMQHESPADREAMIRRLWPYRDPFNDIRDGIARLDPDRITGNALSLELGISSEKSAAADYFRSFPRAPERIVPLLIANLAPSSSANLLQTSCHALGAYGTNARSALPLLSNLMGDRRRYVANAASNAIVQIAVR